MIKVIQTDSPAADRLEEDHVFQGSGREIDFTSYDCMDEDRLVEICTGADALIVAYAPITSRVIDSMPKCKGISFMATGFNSVDLDHATAQGIVVTHVAGYCTAEVADHTLGFLLNLSRNINFLHRSAISGAWDYEACGQPNRLSHQTLGIIGLGRIGRQVAKRAQVFGLKVSAYDPYVDAATMQQWGVDRVELDEVLFADFVSLHCCLNDETTNLINAVSLKKMKKSAYLINTARGACVDIDALSEALGEYRIAGAALDVVLPEPLPTDHRLFRLNNVVVTPHAAFLSSVSLKEVRKKCCEEVVSILKGEIPCYVVNPEVLKQENCRMFRTCSIPGGGDQNEI